MDGAIFHVGGTHEKIERWTFIGNPDSDFGSNDFKKETLSSIGLLSYPSLFTVQETFCA